MATVPQAAKFAQVAGQLRQRIESGAFPSGELPPTTALARDLGVSIGTVRRALAELDAAGLTVGGQGRTRFVRVDGDDAGTLAARVASALRGQIADGIMPRGSRLPAESELAATHRVARATVRAALALLEASGEVTRRSGRRYVAGAVEPDRAHERIAADLRKAITAGRYSTGRLPGENALAAEYGASRPTVRKALEALQGDGLVYSAPKQGWFVTAAGTTGRKP